MRTGDLVMFKKRNWSLNNTSTVTGVLMEPPRRVGKRYTEVRILTGEGRVMGCILTAGEDDQIEVLSEVGGT